MSIKSKRRSQAVSIHCALLFVLFSPAETCLTEDKVDYAGNDIRMIFVDVIDGCKEACIAEVECAGENLSVFEAHKF